MDRVRDRIAPLKCKTDQWLEVMRIGHELGLRSSATMMFGHVETVDDRIEHLQRLRDTQDETGGFTAFICWTFQPENTRLKAETVTSAEYLRMQALSRIFLDNFENVQSSWVTQGPKIGQIALKFGANDFGSVMMEENVVSSAGTTFRLNAGESSVSFARRVTSRIAAARGISFSTRVVLLENVLVSWTAVAVAAVSPPPRELSTRRSKGPRRWGHRRYREPSTVGTPSRHMTRPSPLSSVTLGALNV